MQPSPGCARASLPVARERAAGPASLAAGRTVDLWLDDPEPERADGAPERTKFRVSIPSSYKPGAAAPLLLHFAGWTYGHDSTPELHEHALEHGYIACTPTGYSETLWPSWNGAGSTGSPGPLGPTCAAGSPAAPCYRSCGECPDGELECKGPKRGWVAWSSLSLSGGRAMATADSMAFRSSRRKIRAS